MAAFRYKGLSQDGQDVSGTIDSSRMSSALQTLAERRISVYTLEPVETRERQLKRRTPKSTDYYQLIQQLAVLLKAGIPLLDAVESLSRMVDHQIMLEKLESLSRLLRSGASLSEGLREYFPEMPTIVPNLVSLGERTGALPQTLSILADQLRFQEELKTDLRGALTYPGFLMVVGLVAVLFMFLFVVPRFRGMLGEDADSFTGLTGVIFGLSQGLQDYGLIVAMGLGAAILFLVLSWRNPARRSRITSGLQRFPIVGPLLRQRELADWTRTVGLSLEARANLLDSVTLARDVIRSSRNRAAFDDLARDLRAGTALDEALRKVPDLDPVVLNLAAVGAKAGNMGEMLLLATDILDKSVRARSTRLGKLAEPIAILLISSIIGVVVISMVTAMTSLYDVGFN